MVRRIQAVLIAACLIFLFLLSLVLLFQMARWAPLANFGQQAIAGIAPGFQVLILLLAIAVVIVIAVLWVRQLREEVFFTKEGEEGSITIVESAITRYIKQVAPDVDAVRITNTAQGLVVDLFARVRVSSGTLPQIERNVRERVRHALEETLGLGGVASINVVIKGFEVAGPRAGIEGAAGAGRPAEGAAAATSGEAAPEPWVRLSPRSEATDVKGETPAETSEPGPGERGC